MRLLMLLAVLQGGCLLESESVEDGVKCGPRDLTPECCLKQFPGQWERCTGSPEPQAAEVVGRAPSPALKLVAAGMTGVVMAQGVHIHSAERRGTELAVDLLTEIEREIVRCVRQADTYVNNYHFKGRSPSWELCQQIKVGEQTTWAAYLGIFKHVQAWPCLREALDKLLPKKGYQFQPRFYVNPRTGRWEHMDPNLVSQIVTREGWKGLTGTIEPDLILMDEKGVVVHVYDLKFPCPEANDARWEKYREGRWRDELQGDVYKRALRVTPRLVSPREGVVPINEE